MPVTNSAFQFFWQDRSVSSHFRSGVSLHSHTMYSEESLDMVPRYTARVPYLGRAVRRLSADYSAQKGRAIDFGLAFWTPPLTPRQAYRLEEKQIQRRFQLPAIVSLTDHDDIRAGALLQVLDRFQKTPVSTEWTVPFGGTFFHFGLHNLPAEQASDIMWELARFTANPAPERLAGLLHTLDSFRDVLVVLNHPLWDETGIGMQNHESALGSLLRAHGNFIHALELNGLRSWNENARVISLAQQMNLPTIAGGDRHGREPNAILNLTAASSLPEFIGEVRYRRTSHTVFMPQYREPLKLRVLQTMADVVNYYPENIEGRRLWSDRIFYRDPVSGEPVPLTSIWNDGAPRIVRYFLAAMGLAKWRGVRSALRIAFEDRSTPACPFNAG